MWKQKQGYSSSSSSSFQQPGYKRGCKRFAGIVWALGFLLLGLACMNYIVEKNTTSLKNELTYIRSKFEHRVKRGLNENEHSRLSIRDSERSQRYRRSDDSPQTAAKTGHGVVYYRWGRRDCSGPNNQLVYHGIAAGSLSSYTGGASNTLCLHSNVSYDDGFFQNGAQGSSRIYGMEYRDSSWINSMFNLSLTEGNGIMYHSVPCAVCLATTRITQVMIPGQGSCPTGWSKEYSGYIMAGGISDKHSSEAICVDDTPQVVPGTSGSNGGAYLYVSEASCTSLLCEPYVDLREIRCVVCTI